MSSSRKKIGRNKRRAVTVVLLVILFFCVIGWFWVNSIAKSKLESQLVAAGLQSPRIGSVHVGLGGVVANDIQVESMDGIELSIRRLTVRQSIFELARGVTPMDAIVLNGSKLSLDSRAIKGDDSFSLSDIDFSGVTLPAEKIELDDFELSLLLTTGYLLKPTASSTFQVAPRSSMDRCRLVATSRKHLVTWVSNLKGLNFISLTNSGKSGPESALQF
jgi:autotransporter translocation and assembly factor TamB